MKQLAPRIREYWGLWTDPFAPSTNPPGPFRSTSHTEALAALEIGICCRRGLILLVGDEGLGKTTVLEETVERLSGAAAFACVQAARLDFTSTGLLSEILRGFGSEPVSECRGELHHQLEEVLVGLEAQGRTGVLVVDDAQDLDEASLGELQQVLDYESAQGKLLQVVLSGRPRLLPNLASKKVVRLGDRIAIRCGLSPMSAAETRDYVLYRLESAGGYAGIFSRRALSSVVKSSRGVPRTIDLICRGALERGFERRAQTVEPRDVRAARHEAGESSRTRRHGGLRWTTALMAIVVAAIGLWSANLLRQTSSQGIDDAGSALLSAGAASGWTSDGPSPDSNRDPWADEPSRVSAVSDGGRGDYEWVEVGPGDTIGTLVVRREGYYSPEIISEVLSANPELQPERLMPGQLLRYPRRPG